MKLAEIAAQLEVRLRGDGEVEIKGLQGIAEAQPGELTFVSNPKYVAAARTTRASAIIVAEDFPELAKPTLRTPDPYFTFARAVELFYQPPRYAPGIHPTAVIDKSARIGRGAHIGAYAVIESEVEIGENCVLLPHVVIYRGAKIGNNFFAHAHAMVREFCRIGNNVILQNGAIVGSDGFGFAKDSRGAWRKIPQSGPAVIADNVEIQAYACIDRASIGETRIEEGAKIDNLVQVGHGSRVGANAMLCSQVGLAGSTEVGKDVILAGQVGIAGHCRVGDGAIVTAQSGVPNDVEAGKTVSGYPAIENKQWLRAVAVFNRLPEIAKALRSQARSKESPGKD